MGIREYQKGKEYAFLYAGGGVVIVYWLFDPPDVPTYVFLAAWLLIGYYLLPKLFRARRRRSTAYLTEALVAAESKALGELYGRGESEDSPAVLDAKKNLADAYLHNNNYTAAREILQELISVLSARTSVDSREVLILRNILGVNESRSGDAEAAIRSYLRAYRDALRTLPVDDELIGTLEFNLGLAYLETRKYEAGKGLLEKAYKQRERLFGKADAYTEIARSALLVASRSPLEIDRKLAKWKRTWAG